MLTAFPLGGAYEAIAFTIDGVEGDMRALVAHRLILL